jgi:hypothetical protein
MDVMNLRVEFKPSSEMRSGTYAVTPSVMIGYELEFKTTFSKFIADPGFHGLVWLAWKAMHVAGETVKPFGPLFWDELAGMPEPQNNAVPTDATR